MDTVQHNQKAWDQKVENGSVYTRPVSSETIQESKAGYWEITVTTEKKVPRDWFPDSLAGLKVLCLASGGGQQGPVLAAAGAEVTVLDNSMKQLEQDQKVAEREGLDIRTVHGNMADLSIFKDETFDFVIHPVSNLFVENIHPVWLEAARVLKQQGVLIAGFTNPLVWLFDEAQEENGVLAVKHPIPSSTLDHLPKEKIEDYLNAHQPIEYAHTLENQIQGQIRAGLVITGVYEDDFGGTRLLDKYIKSFMATRAVKLNVQPNQTKEAV